MEARSGLAGLLRLAVLGGLAGVFRLPLPVVLTRLGLRLVDLVDGVLAGLDCTLNAVVCGIGNLVGERLEDGHVEPQGGLQPREAVGVRAGFADGSIDRLAVRLGRRRDGIPVAAGGSALGIDEPVLDLVDPLERPRSVTVSIQSLAP
jgi:hypothetical protein